MKLLASGVAEVHSMLAETDETRVVWKFCLFGSCIGRANDVIAEALHGALKYLRRFSLLQNNDPMK